MFVPAPDVVDEDVEAPMRAGDRAEHLAHLRVVPVIVLDGDAVAADRINLSGRCMDRSGQLRGRCTFRGRASGNVDRCARFTEAKRDALADASAGAGCECNLTFKWSLYVVREVVEPDPDDTTLPACGRQRRFLCVSIGYL